MSDNLKATTLDSKVWKERKRVRTPMTAWLAYFLVATLVFTGVGFSKFTVTDNAVETGRVAAFDVDFISRASASPQYVPATDDALAHFRYTLKNQPTGAAEPSAAYVAYPFSIANNSEVDVANSMKVIMPENFPYTPQDYQDTTPPSPTYTTLLDRFVNVGIAELSGLSANPTDAEITQALAKFDNYKRADYADPGKVTLATCNMEQPGFTYGVDSVIFSFGTPSAIDAGATKHYALLIFTYGDEDKAFGNLWLNGMEMAISTSQVD